MLEGEDLEKQLAAAVVLTELGLRDAVIVEGLTRLLQQPVAALQQKALAALAGLRPRKALPAMLALVDSRDAGVRVAAAEAVAHFGEDALPAVRERLAAAPAGARRPWEELVGRLGGDSALPTLLASLSPEDLDGARAAILPLRQRLKIADARQRRRVVEQARSFLDGKPGARSAAGRLAAVKALGYAEELATVPALLAIAGRERERSEVREEAVIAVRLALGAGRDPGKPAGGGRGAGKQTRTAAGMLLLLAEKAPAPVARAALYSLVGLPLSAAQVGRVGRLAGHPESERALIAIELSGRTPGAASARALAQVLLQTSERARAEAAAQALGARPEAAPALAGALLATADRDRAEMLSRLLRPQLARLDRAMARKLIARAAVLVETGGPAADPLVHLAGTLDPPALAGALRELAARLRKARKYEQALRVLRVLGRSREGAAEDGLALAVMELTHGLRDQAFVVFGQLADQGVDVVSALRRERSLEERHRYDVGFHFIEHQHPLGEELLADVARVAGRSKLGQMAKAKLRLLSSGP